MTQANYAQTCDCGGTGHLIVSASTVSSDGAVTHYPMKVTHCFCGGFPAAAIKEYPTHPHVKAIRDAIRHLEDITLSAADEIRAEEAETAGTSQNPEIRVVLSYAVCDRPFSQTRIFKEFRIADGNVLSMKSFPQPDPIAI